MAENRTCDLGIASPNHYMTGHIRYRTTDKMLVMYNGCKSKGKGIPYSTAERRVPELIPVLGSQSAGDMSYKPGGRLPILSARPASYPRNP